MLNIINFFKFFLLFFTFHLMSCQRVEVLDSIVFDYDQLSKLTITAEELIINEIYEIKYSEPYIDHSLKISPKSHLIYLLKNNISNIGSENKLIINIHNASLKKNEILNSDAKKFQEKNILQYEINFLVEYILLNDSNKILSVTNVESKRSLTSGKFISIMEYEKIIDSLILDGLVDFINKSKELINIHMSGYIL
mgnify:CR=1 FL=1